MEQLVEDVSTQIADATRKREAAAALLDGRETAKDGTKWTGTQPTSPMSEQRFTVVCRPGRLKAWATDFGLPALLLLLELWIVRGTLQRDLRTDSVIEGIVYAVPAVLLATVIPFVLGTQLAGLARRERMNRTDRFVLALAPVWVVAAVFLARLRTLTAEQAAVARAAREQEISVSDVDPAQVYDFGWAWAMWLTILLGIGVALIAVKIAFYNPALTAALKADSQLALLRPRYRGALAHRDRLRDNIAMQQLATQSNEHAWRWYIDHTLPAIGGTVKAHYRKTLVTAVADPSFTTGVTTSPQHLDTRRLEQIPTFEIQSRNGGGPGLAAEN